MLELSNIPKSVYVRALELMGYANEPEKTAREVFDRVRCTQLLNGELEQALCELIKSDEGYQIIR